MGLLLSSADSKTQICQGDIAQGQENAFLQV